MSEANPIPAQTAGAPELSVIIPAFNEEKRLGHTLLAVDHYLRRRGAAAEILVVNDGSRDGTAALARGFHGYCRVRVLENPGNRGKGYSVRAGMLAAGGRLLLFSDADLSAPIEEVIKLEAALSAGADIAIGSRSQRQLLRRRQSAWRETAGRIFNWIVWLALGLRFRDTQCGFKLFRREAAARLFPRQRITGWGFDPELLYLARRERLRVAEVPVVWSHAEGAKIRMFRDSLRMFWEVMRIRGNAALGRYRRRREPAAAQGAGG